MLGGARNEPPGAALEGGENRPVVLAHEHPFRIGQAEFRPATREIVLAGDTHVIEPRVMQVLVALHRANGAVVTKDDLTRSCWEGRVVGEDAINRVISRLRAVGEKQAGGQFRIETITKVGYRLIDDGKAPSSPVAEPAQSARMSITRRGMLVSGGAVGALLAGGVVWRLSKRAELPPEAQALVNSARNDLYSGTADETANAVGALRQAAQIAPSSALVWGQLGYGYMRQSLLAPAQQRAQLRERANAAIQRATAIDPNQPDALAAQVVGMHLFRNWTAVDRASYAGLRKHPDNVGLLQTRINVLMQSGRAGEALPLIRQIIRQRPDVGHLRTGEGLALWDLGRFDEADVSVGSSLARWPRFYATWFPAVYYRMYTGKPAEAAAMVSDVGNRPVGIPDWNFAIVQQQAEALASGDPAKVKDAVLAGVNIAHRGTGFAENSAIFAAFVGDFDTAFELLDALYFNRGFAMPDAYFAPEQGQFSGTDRHTYNLFLPPMRALRRDRRFAALTRELGLDDYWRATNSRALVVP